MALSNRPKTAFIVAVNNAIEHHITIVYRSIFLGETISVIEAKDGWQVSAHDQYFEGLSLTDFLKKFREEPDVVFIWGDVHHASVMTQLARHLKNVSPESRAFAFGRSTTFIPQFFERAPFDAVHVSGDREAAISEYLDFIDGTRPITDVAGIAYRDPDRSSEFRRNKGKTLNPSDWPVPNLSRLPIEQYKEYVLRAYGDRYSKRVSVTAAKGCTWNCAYCGATQEEGIADRRQSVSRLFHWATQAELKSFDCYLHLYAPDLFFDQRWIEAFCEEYKRSGSSFIWRGVTTTITLQDSGLVATAGAAGCRELAIGVEHINAKSRKSAKSTLDQIAKAAATCKSSGISLKALVMLGYPGQTKEDVEFLISYLTENRLIIRFTGYTPLHRLSSKTADELDAIPLEDFDRRTYFDEAASSLDRKFFYETLTRNDGYVYP